MKTWVTLHLLLISLSGFSNFNNYIFSYSHEFVCNENTRPFDHFPLTTDPKPVEVARLEGQNATTATLDIASVTTNPSCHASNGDPDGEIRITSQGGIQPYIYSWWTVDGSGLDSTAEDQSGLTAGTYTVEVTDMEGNSEQLSFSLTQPTFISILASTVDEECDAANGSIDVNVAGGSGGYSYSWTTTDGSGLDLTTQNQSGLSAGVYNLVVTDANGCTQGDTYSLENLNEVDVQLDLPINQICRNSGNIVLEGGMPSGGTYTGIGVVNGQFDPSVAGIGLHEIVYSFSSASGCENSSSALMHVIDANHVECEESAILSVSATISRLSCHTANGDPDGSIELEVQGGTPPYTYRWTTADGAGLDPNKANQDGLYPGTYTIIVTDADGNTAMQRINMLEPPIISILASATDLSCHGRSGAPDGQIDVNVSGGTPPYTYTWSSAVGSALVAMSEDQNGLDAGTYELIVTDANGCTQADSYTLTSPDPVDVFPSITSVTCGMPNGALDGRIELDISGGVGEYSYFWTTTDGSGLNVTEQNQSGLSAGLYRVIVTDANGCSAAIDSNLGENNTLESIGRITSIDASCAQDNGSITIEILDGSLYSEIQFSFDGGMTWFPSISDQIGSITYADLAEGDYDLWISDAGLTCIQDIPEDVTIVQAQVTLDLTINELCTRRTELRLIGGFPRGGTYSGTGVTGSSFDPDVAGPGTHEITYTYTDGNGCTQSATDNITVHERPFDIFTQVTICEEDLPSYPPDERVIIHTGANGCEYTETILLSVRVDSTDQIYNITISEAELPYLWFGQELTESGTYVVERLDSGGCTYNEILELTVTGISSVTEELASFTKIYPNPAQEILHIESERNLHLTVINQLGQSVTEQNLIQGVNQVNVSILEVGIYLLQFSDGHDTWTDRILIQK